jgi:hypothetical protein
VKIIAAITSETLSSSVAQAMRNALVRTRAMQKPVKAIEIRNLWPAFLLGMKMAAMFVIAQVR